MKRFTLICFIFISLYTQAQTPGPFILTKDSLEALLDIRAWKFYDAADSPAMAAKNYDDSKWRVGRSKVRMDNDSVRALFKGFGWFRFHLKADSTVINIPMALAITQSGASEVYWDGELIGKGGVIKGKDSSEYYNPRFEPFLFTIKDTGEHVIAVRYANYDAEKNEDLFTFSGAGFNITINTAESFIEQQSDTTMGRMLLILLFSIFGSFSLVHLMLFLYNRSQVSNLYFSIFAFTISLTFLFSTISMVTSWVSLLIYVRHFMLPVLCLACLSLSGVINSVFPDKRKIRFWIIAGIALAVMVQSLFNLPQLTLGVIIMLAATSLETVVKIIIAVKKKRPGSRIIGFGFFFLAFFVLTILLSILIVGDFVINDSTLLGIIVGISLIISILSIPFSMSAYLAKNYATVNKDLKNQLEQVKLLSEKSLQQELEKQQMLESRKEELEKEVAVRTSEVLIQKDKIEKQHEELKSEKKKSDDLLLNILPGEVADELKEHGFAKAKQYNHVSVLFTDFVNFTGISSQLSAEKLVSEIDKCFKAFDEIIGRNGLEKIKTIGDAYLAVCGLPNEDADHAKKVTRAAIDIREYIATSKNNGGIFDIRIGIHSGPVVAGIVGVKKFAYDIWGDTVNTAARMEQNSELGKINISGATFELIKDEFTCEHRGKIEARNKGMIDMYFVD